MVNRELTHHGIDGMKWGYSDGKRNGKRVAGEEEKDTKDEKSEKAEKTKKKSGTLDDKEIEDLAKKVIRGDYGNGDDRKKALGDNYADIQSKVNEMLGITTSKTKKKDDSDETEDTKKKRSKKKSKTKSGTKSKSKSKTEIDTRKAKDTIKHGYGYIPNHRYELELTHHGIKGMKWGVRRYQNEDGTLTAAGKKRKNITADQIQKTKNLVDAGDRAANIAKGNNATIRNIRTRNTMDLSNMSDKELRDAVNRMNMEQQYRNLSSQNVSKGQSYVSNVLDVAGVALSTTSSVLAIALAIKQLKMKG